MAFPFSYKGITPFMPYQNEKESIEKILDYAKLKIANAEIKQIERNPNEVKFKGTVCRFAWNGFNFMNGITKGKIYITPKKITSKKTENQLAYEVYFTEFFIIALLFNLLYFAVYDNLKYIILLEVLIWIVFYALSCFISIARFKSFINKIQKQVYLEEQDKKLERS